MFLQHLLRSITVPAVIAALALPGLALAQDPDDSMPGRSELGRGRPSMRVDRDDTTRPPDGIIDTLRTTRYEYDTFGQLVFERIETDAGADGTLSSVTEIQYDYDDRGNRILTDHQFDLGADGSFLATQREEWVYDDRSRLLSRLFIVDQAGDGTLSGGDVRDSEVFERGEDGFPLTRTASFEQFGNLRITVDTYTSWTPAGLPTGWTTTVDNFVANGAGGWNPTTDSSSISSATYDVRGHQASQTTSLDSGRNGSIDQIATTSWTRDVRGNELVRVEERDALADGTINYRQTRTTTLDSHGSRLSYTDFTDNNGNGVNDARDFGFEDVYVNDRRGNHVSLTSEVWTNMGGVVSLRRRTQTEWTY